MEMTQAGRVTRLERLGFKAAGAQLGQLLKTKRKLALAYEHYRFVTPENVQKFRAELLKGTGKNMHDPINMEYKALAFTPIEEYPAVPPEEVLVELEKAQDRKCFDSFEIAYIKNVKDPLLFGRVEGTPNRFFIAQWDNDISIDDLIKENEG